MKCFLVFIVFAFGVFAEESVEKIEVTGSRIKRIDIEGPSPMIILNQEDLEESGYNSIGDVLRDKVISPFGVGRERSGSSSCRRVFCRCSRGFSFISYQWKACG